MDKDFIDVFESMKVNELFEKNKAGKFEACGIMPIAATVMAAKMFDYNKVKILKYANSGDTFGNKNSVVGYLSAAIYREYAVSQDAAVVLKESAGKESYMLNNAERKRLLQIARESIESFVRDGKRKKFTEADPILNANMGAFVTLHEAGQLRGCIGHMVATGPLYRTVADMAVEAATGDPRFPKLSPKEIEKVDIEISALSPLKRVASVDEIKIPGHGVIVKRGFSSGVYLPQVATETGWTKEEFLTSLCGEKAGIAPYAWKDPGTELYVFTAEVFGEKDIK
jgi:hypothetical protein